jgi:5'-3' exonuclease
LNKLLDSDSVISEFYPEEFEIDLEGKRNDWEGVPILPFVDLKRVNDAYYELINDVKEN